MAKSLLACSPQHSEAPDLRVHPQTAALPECHLQKLAAQPSSEQPSFCPLCAKGKSLLAHASLLEADVGMTF